MHNGGLRHTGHIVRVRVLCLLLVLQRIGEWGKIEGRSERMFKFLNEILEGED
jgi:hypothetical protein